MFMNPDIIFSKSLAKAIPNLNYLSEASEFLEHFNFDARKGTPIKQLKQVLKKDYFPTQKDDAILEYLNENQGFDSYPKLKSLLLYVFTAQENEPMDRVLSRLREINQAPNDVVINIHECQLALNQYNKRYGQWNAPEKVELYALLVRRCRQVITLFENNPSDKDRMAFEYAYKIMAIFDESGQHNVTLKTALYHISKKLSLFLNSTNDLVNPYHDVFLVFLKNFPHASHIQDKEGWKRLINDKNSDKKKVLKCFCQAEKFEKKILEQTSVRSAPHNYRHALEIASLCTYDRAGEDPSFALLCNKYDVIEKDFNRCLDYIQKNQIEKKHNNFIASQAGWPKKQVGSDNIPDICLSGRDEAQSFYWLKLRSDDKRALILGQITDCCQHIGGDSEACVRDALQRDDNGLYILVKAKKVDLGPPNPSELLDEHHYKIVGQSYVWLSQTGNLCLDSIECLKNEISEPALQAILRDFGAQILIQNPHIKRVTLGRGGKTPKDLFPKTPIAEKMKQGYQYDDSNNQYQIAVIEQRIDPELLENCTARSADIIKFLHLYFDEQDLLINLKKLIAEVADQRHRENILYRFAQCVAKYGSENLSLNMLSPVRVDDWGVLRNAPVPQIFIHSNTQDVQLILEYLNEERGRYFIDLLLEMSDEHEPYARQIISNINRIFHDNKVIPYFIEKVHCSYDDLLDLLPEENDDIALVHFLKWSHPSQILSCLINDSQRLEKYAARYLPLIENLENFTDDAQYLAEFITIACQQEDKRIDSVFKSLLKHIKNPLMQAHIFRKFLFLQDNSEEKMKVEYCLPINPLNYPAQPYSLEQLMLSITRVEDLLHVLKCFPEKEEIIISRVLLMQPNVVISAMLYHQELRKCLNECDIASEIEHLTRPESFYDYDDTMQTILLDVIFQQSHDVVRAFIKLYPQAHAFLLQNNPYEYFLHMLRLPEMREDKNSREPYIQAIIEQWAHLNSEKFFNGKMTPAVIEQVFILLVDELPQKECADFCTALCQYAPHLLLNFIQKYDPSMTGKFETRAGEENEKHDKVDLLDVYDNLIMEMEAKQLKDFLIKYQNLNSMLLGEDEVVFCIEGEQLLELLVFDGLYTIDNYFKRLITYGELSRFNVITIEEYQRFLGKFSQSQREALFLKYPYAHAMISFHTQEHSFWEFIEAQPITERISEILTNTERYRPQRNAANVSITGQKRGRSNFDTHELEDRDNQDVGYKDSRRKI